VTDHVSRRVASGEEGWVTSAGERTGDRGQLEPEVIGKDPPKSAKPGLLAISLPSPAAAHCTDQLIDFHLHHQLARVHLAD
jgi:hypothetical protein